MATVTGDIWSFTIESKYYSTFVPPRLFTYEDTYDPSLTWQFVDGEYQWTELADTNGGGRYNNQLILFSFDSNGEGSIFYN